LIYISEDPSEKEAGTTQKRLQEYREYEKSLKDQLMKEKDPRNKKNELKVA